MSAGLTKDATRPELGWLVAKPIAHRGLHDLAAGVIENSGSAAKAAIAGGFGIECDVQISADGEAMVHHDHALGRLTEGSGKLAELTAAALKQVAFKATSDRMITLGELCDIAGGRVPLTLAITSPAHRPIQTTKDLPAFWRGSWREVAKEMRGRYPKHPWPDDPASAAATLRTKKASGSPRP